MPQAQERPKSVNDLNSDEAELIMLFRTLEPFEVVEMKVSPDGTRVSVFRHTTTKIDWHLSNE